MNVRKLTTGIALAWLTAACAEVQTNEPTAADSSGRITLSGFSAAPPQGAGWVVQAKQPYLISFVQPQKDTDHALVANAQLLGFPKVDSPEQFLGIVKSAREHQIDPKKFKLTTHEETLDPARGSYCVRYHLRGEDQGSQAALSAPRLVRETYGYTCRHPKRVGAVVDFSFSEISRPTGEGDADLAARAEPFLKGVRFEPLLDSSLE